MNKKIVVICLISFFNSIFKISYAKDIPVSRELFFDAEPPSYLKAPVQVDFIRSQNDEVFQSPLFDEIENYESDISQSNKRVDSNTESYIRESYLSNNKKEAYDSHLGNKDPLKVISLQEAANLIVAYHPRLAQAKGDEKSEAEMVNVAKSAYYPEVRGGLGMKYDRRTTSDYDKEYTPNADIEIKQTLYDFGRTTNSVKSAEYGHLGAIAFTSATNEELIYAATSDVVAIVRDQKLIQLAKQQVSQVKSLSKLVEERYEKGASNLSDLLQAQSRVDDVESVELDTEARYESTLRNLGIMIGMPDINGVIIGDLPKNLDQSCSIISDWEEIPKYAIADLESKRAQAELDFSKSNEMPTISLQGNVSRPLNDSSRRAARNETRVSLNVSVPFYEGGRLEANKRAASNRKISAEARKEEIRLEINQALSQLQINLSNMQKRQSLLVRRVENLKGTKELYKKQYLDLGTRSLIDLLNSEQEFHQAQVDVEINKFSIIQAQLDCALYQGKLRDYFNIVY